MLTPFIMGELIIFSFVDDIKQDLSAYRIAHLTAPCPSDKTL